MGLISRVSSRTYRVFFCPDHSKMYSTSFKSRKKRGTIGPTNRRRYDSESNSSDQEDTDFDQEKFRKKKLKSQAKNRNLAFQSKNLVSKEMKKAPLASKNQTSISYSKEDLEQLRKGTKFRDIFGMF